MTHQRSKSTASRTASPGSAVIVIAHRGASGYLPEHTREAKALAIGLGADFVEQDIVITRDGVPIVTHDIYIDDVTDVALRFPGRARSDGRFYAIDFTIDELRTLGRFERVNDDGSPVFPGRFPRNACRFGIVTLAEEIELVQGINRSARRNVGLYTEVKFPAWHREQGRDISKITLDTLARYGYESRADNIYFQCFDALELRRVRGELGCDLKLIQLIGENSWNESSTDYDAIRTPAGVAGIAEYADGIGPEISQLVEWPAAASPPEFKDLGPIARSHGLDVHPYTFRTDALPPNAPDATAVLDAIFGPAAATGIFTDFTDVVVEYRDMRRR